MEMVENDLFQLLVNLLLLPQNDIPFPFNRGRVKLGVLEDITDDVDSFGNILLEALSVVDGLLPGCISVEMSTNVFNLELQSVLGTAASTLEGHVFEEVGSSVGDIGFGSRPSIYPDTDRSSLSMGM